MKISTLIKIGFDFCFSGGARMWPVSWVEDGFYKVADLCDSMLRR